MSIKQILQNNIVEVTFTKANGEKRVMLCTTNPSIVGIQTHSNKSGPEHICTVWDIEADGWRSFKIDSISECKIIEEISVVG